jgi:hypothetical protein
VCKRHGAKVSNDVVVKGAHTKLRGDEFA